MSVTIDKENIYGPDIKATCDETFNDYLCVSLGNSYQKTYPILSFEIDTVNDHDAYITQTITLAYNDVKSFMEALTDLVEKMRIKQMESLLTK